MTLADVLAALAGLAIAGAGFASVSLILSLLTPNLVERAALRIAGRPGRSLATGSLFVLALLIVAGSFLKVPLRLAHMAGIGAILSGLSLAVLGGVGMATALARRLQGPAAGFPGIREMLRGVFVLESAALLPIVGWFVVLPLGVLISLGAGFHAVLRRESPAAQPAPAVGA